MGPKKFYLVGVLVLLGVLAYLATWPFKSSLQFYLTVSELQAGEKKNENLVVKMAGKASSIQRVESSEGLVHTFIVTEGGHNQKVSYKGLVPDTFKDGADVVVTGRMAPDGVFVGTELLAKCASKYEAKIQ